ncbi:hypothetical protein EV421DRAFT_1713692 [Armillaria borealis]|uniref:Uncharacterized protein n=1 Tax=Armillaria borealis TaxID=47425 RepID=A0AA39MMS4_9AGAR|nr:hypothetical protein EV421DRAFT_1713692 [Armillaria borealis]
MYLSRFQAVKGGCHSTGALYITICNNPRTIRYLREETILALVLPGPHEPTLEQLNNVLVPLIRDLKNLYHGACTLIVWKPQITLVGFRFVLTLLADLFLLDHIDFPRISNDTELRQSGSQLYRLIFLFLHELWKPYFKLVYDVDMSTARGPTASFAGQVKSFSHLWVEKRRYGAATTARGQSAQYAYIHGRVPVRIDYLFQAVQSFGDVDYIANLAVVRRFQTDEFTTALQLPWYIWLVAVDLGVAIWSADQLGHLEVVEMKHLSGHFVLAPIDIHDQGVWVTITYENVSSD